MHEFHNITDMFIELGALGSPSGPVSIAIQTIKGQRGGTNGRQRIEEHCIDTLCAALGSMPATTTPILLLFNLRVCEVRRNL